MYFYGLDGMNFYCNVGDFFFLKTVLYVSPICGLLLFYLHMSVCLSVCLPGHSCFTP